jgi:hypothetical protein
MGLGGRRSSSSSAEVGPTAPAPAAPTSLSSLLNVTFLAVAKRSVWAGEGRSEQTKRVRRGRQER